MEFAPKPLADLGFTVSGDVVISGIAIDNRKITGGELFAAMPGTNVHGAHFAQKAVDSGAVAVLTDAKGAEIVRSSGVAPSVPIVVVQDVMDVLAHAAALYFGGQPKTMVAVTGTNGKTSVASFCRQIWNELDISAINIGTTGVQGSWSFPLKHTTPDVITLQRVLALAAQSGVTHAAMEASSHGIEQRRLEAVRIQAAGFTNFTQDHLDYHKTFENYFDAKARLFRDILPDTGKAVLNIDDPKLCEFSRSLAAKGIETVTIGRRPDADIVIQNQRFDATGQDVRFSCFGKPYQKRLNLIGGFQAENVLMAAALVIAAGAKAHHVFDTLEHLETVHGRMEFAAKCENGASIFVDYAHTPDAIQTALQAFRPHVMGRLIAIIGAGGDRDTTKRPLMGQAAAQNADVVIVTDDNPRTEDPQSIRNMVLQGTGQGDHIHQISDRAEAILRAVFMLEPGDGMLIMGKGHETGQIIGHDVFPFDDVEQASIAVAALEGKI